MLTHIHPKLPMRNKAITKAYYINNLGFKDISSSDFDHYLILQRDAVELHFFEHNTLSPTENYGQVYIRCNNLAEFYKLLVKNKVGIHPNGQLETKPWGQTEFSLLDPDNNLITFGQNS